MMPARNADYEYSETLVARHPVVCYFVLTFAVSWAGALAVAAPALLRGQPVAKFTGIMMFPVMLLGPSLVGIILTAVVDGRAGLRDLRSRMARVRVPARWYGALLIPPAVMLCVLILLSAFISPVFSPNHFVVGISFGLVAGFFEEIGWMGFAFPKMQGSGSAVGSAILLGALWSLWHVPVVDHLGTATPHGDFWLEYFLVFAAAMTAMRVVIAWVYINTGSVALCQLMHASSTGALVVLSPSHVTPAQEAFWHLLYAAALGLCAVFVVRRFGKTLAGPITRAIRPELGQQAAGMK